MRKTVKAVAKRFKVSGSGKVRFKRASLKHNLGHRRRKGKRKLAKPGYLCAGDITHILGALPHGSIL